MSSSSPSFHRDGSLNSGEDDSASVSSSSDSYSPNSYQPRRRRQRTASSNRGNGVNVTNALGAHTPGRKGAQDKSQPKLCVICGDKAKGVNFNALTCMSCKAFFRRNALRNKEMKCPFQDRCSVDKITRKFCSKCRLKKCFDCGMKKEWILSEEEKLAIKEKIARNRARRQTESAAELSTTNGTRKRGRKNTVSLDYSDALEFRLLDSPQQTQVVQQQQQQQQQSQTLQASNSLDIFALSQTYTNSQSQGISSQRPTSAQQSNNSNNNDIFCMETFDSMDVGTTGNGTDPVFEWPTEAAVVDPTVGADSLANDLNDCCQMLFANDLLFDSEETVKQEFLEMEHSNMNSNDFSQYLLHGTDPNIQNGRCVPLLSCAQQFQQSESVVGPQSLARFQYSKFDDIEAELPDFLSACLGSSNILSSNTATHDPAIHMGSSGQYYQNCQPEMPLPNDLAFLNGGLIQPEKELIAELTDACKLLVSPYRRIVEHDQHESLLSCRVTEHSLMRLVKMSKKISHFAKLNICDRVKLLKAGLIEMLSIRSVLMYLPEREAWSMVNDDFKINLIVKMNVIRPFCTRANWQRHRDFPGLFRLEWQRDPTIFDLLTTLVLFTPRPNLTEPSRVLDEHMRYSYLLRRYLETKYSGDSEQAKEVYDRLMDTIKEMRELNGDIVNFFRGYHKLMGASPLFTQILELPPSAECIERSNEILSALSDESNNYDFHQQTSNIVGAATNGNNGNTGTANSNSNSNLIGSNGATLMTPNILGSIPSGNSIFVQENIAENGTATASNNNACFGILNSVN